MSSDEESEVRSWAKIVSSVDSILEKLGSVFPWIKNWLFRPVILKHQQTNWWHMGKADGTRPVMQIVSYWYVTNSTDKEVKILNSYVKVPRGIFSKNQVQGRVVLKDVNSAYHGSYPVPPYTTTDLHADFWVEPPFSKQGKDIKLNIVFIDQYGQKRTIRNVKFKSDHRKKIEKVKLAEEAIYEIEHEIEKNVAAVLKDEVSRYSKYGRRSGELGSVQGNYKGKVVKSINQDSWTSSKSGERQEIIADPENSYISSENGDALVKLYEGLSDQTDKDLFVNSLMFRLSREKEYYCVSYLIFYVLFRIGVLKRALDAAKTQLAVRKSFWEKILRQKTSNELLEEYQRFGLSDMLALINGFLRYEHPSFANDDLDLIEEYISSVDEHTFKINEKINSARAFRLST